MTEYVYMQNLKRQRNAREEKQQIQKNVVLSRDEITIRKRHMRNSKQVCNILFV